MDREQASMHSTIGTIVPRDGGGWDIIRRTAEEGDTIRVVLGTRETADDALEFLHRYRLENGISPWPYIPKTQFRALILKELHFARCHRCGERKAIHSFSAARPSYCLTCLMKAKFKGKLDSDRGYEIRIAKEFLKVNERFAADMLMNKPLSKDFHVSPGLPLTELTRRIFKELKASQQLEYCRTFTERGVTPDVEFIAKVRRYGYQIAIATLIDFSTKTPHFKVGTARAFA